MISNLKPPQKKHSGLPSRPTRTKLFLPPFFLICLVAAPFALADGPAPIPFTPVQNGPGQEPVYVLPYATDHLLVQFEAESMAASNLGVSLEKGTEVLGVETGIASVDILISEFGVTKTSRPYIELNNTAESTRLGIDRWFRFDVAEGTDVVAAVKSFAIDSNVENAIFDFLAFPMAIPTDPNYPDSWGHNNTAQLPDLDWGGTNRHTLPTTVGTNDFDSNAQNAWDNTQGFGDASVIIAIVDTGVDIDHPDLSLVPGYDFGDDDDNPDDDCLGTGYGSSCRAGHGTSCAGVAAAMANNGLGACGAAPNCRVMPLKVANEWGFILFSFVENAIFYAADNGADVISLSIGAYVDSVTCIDAAIEYASTAGCILLAATGNHNISTITYPANNPHVISVGAASPCGDRKRSSMFSDECSAGVNTDPQRLHLRR